jgi:hypothetical protein
MGLLTYVRFREEFRALLGVRKYPKNESWVLWAGAMGISLVVEFWRRFWGRGLVGIGVTFLCWGLCGWALVLTFAVLSLLGYGRSGGLSLSFLSCAHGFANARWGKIWRDRLIGYELVRSRRPSVIGSRMRRRTGLGFALEDVDDDHVAATARADEPRLCG